MEETHKYDDIIHLTRPESPSRPRMSAVERGAQFSPFAALTGYEEAVRETARLTEEKRELTEDEKSAIDGRLRLIMDRLSERPRVGILYFHPDGRKSGGEYVRVTGVVREIDPLARTVAMESGDVIPIDHIRDIEGELFLLMTGE